MLILALQLFDTCSTCVWQQHDSYASIQKQVVATDGLQQLTPTSGPLLIYLHILLRGNA
jgi:hypothetical protein